MTFTDYDYKKRIVISPTAVLAYREWKDGTIIYIPGTSLIVCESFDEVNTWYKYFNSEK